MKKLFLLVGILILQAVSFSVSAQPKPIKGIVTDEQGLGIPGVNILVKGTTNGTISNLDGNYTLNTSPSDVLVFSFIGYVSQEINVGVKTVINVSLKQQTLDVDEIVVVGYGVQKKSLSTAAISSVKSEELKTSPASRADQAIQGKTAGISILSNSGSPGSGSQIRIRGVNSNGDSNPLFIVDGMKTGDINNIDPSDIASMEILKDAASAAIYGTEGANGVIIITTKMGKKGAAKISYDFQYGILSSRSDMDMMNSEQYKTWIEESGDLTSGVTPTGIDTNWQDEMFETAPMQKHHISFSGASDKTSYMISGSYFSQDGIVGGDKASYDRYTGRVNLKSDLKEWLETGTNFSYSHSKQKYVSEDSEYGSLVNTSLLIDPLTPVTYNSTPSKITDLIAAGKTPLTDDNGNYYGISDYVGGEISNPKALLSSYNNNIIQDKLLGTAHVTIKPIKGLRFTSRIGLDLTFQSQKDWVGKYYMTSEKTNTQSYVNDDLNKWSTWLWENFASYDYSINDHNFTILAGYSAQEYESPDYSLHSAPLIKEGTDYAYQGYTTSNEYDRTSGGYVNQTMTSMFGRISYNYQNRYMMEGSIRRDAASVFPSDDRAAIFPAISAGWIISEEDFAKIPGINYLKLRASWGQNGSKSNLEGNEDKLYWKLSGIQYPNSSNALVSGADITSLSNTDLTWERTAQTDIGIDLRSLDGKLSFSVDYYNKKTKDLIITGSGPLSVGNTFPSVNGGTVTNKGFDFETGYKNSEGKFKYSINANFSTLNNEVTDLKVETPISGLNLRGYDLTWFEKGHPIWYFKGYKTDGIDKTTGDVNVVDVNGDGEITADDQTEIGDPHPDFLYGLTFNASYHNFDFNIFIQGTQGNDVFTGWFRSDRATSNKPLYMYEDRWTTINTDASWPTANNTSDYVYRSDLMVQDGSYLRIKQIQLGYNLPNNLLSKYGIGNLRVYVSLDDYFTFTKYEGLDPEAGSSDNTSIGVDKGLYPIAGKVLFGFSINF